MARHWPDARAFRSGMPLTVSSTVTLADTAALGRRGRGGRSAAEL
ncbi:hypothetical protein ABZX92_22225 [Lentzea sp. NPDC006480]